MMRQILVTIDETDAATQSIRRAISMLKGVVSTSIFIPKKTVKTKQEQYVRDSLTSALDEVEKAEKGKVELKSADDFIKELLEDVAV